MLRGHEETNPFKVQRVKKVLASQAIVSSQCDTAMKRYTSTSAAESLVDQDVDR